jgi:hypothetical protein
MFRKLVVLGLVVIVIAALIPAEAFARQDRVVQVTLWNGEARAWRYYRVDETTTVQLYYYWFAQTDQQVQDFITHADFEITLDGQPLFESQADVDAAWQPIGEIVLKGKTLKRSEWTYTLPPLTPGQHVIHTIISIDAPVEDGVFLEPYPAGALHNTTNIVTVYEGTGEPVVSQAQPAQAATPKPGTPPKEIHDKPVVGTFITHAYTYWAPDENKPVDPPVVLYPGMTLWVFGMDSTYRYYKVLLDAAYLWVHADTLGPTNDGVVWHNDPLPNIVVE